METRDQWYKPNLLYNIHYRPPKKPETPKMIVETVQYNPSVCTCGEHGCQPHYRMEKRVLWTNKEVCISKQQSKVKGGENKDDRRESKFNESITKQERKNGSVIESKQMKLIEEIGQECCSRESDASNQMGLKSEIDQEFRFIKGNGNKYGAYEGFKDRKSGEDGVRNSYQASDAVQEIANIEVESSDDGDADEKGEEKKKECDCKLGVGSNDRKAYVCISEEANYLDSIRENNNSGRSDRDKFEDRIIEGVNSEKRICSGCESALNDDCNDDGRSSENNHIDNDHLTGDDAGAIDIYGTGNDEGNCSINRILQNSSADTADSCRPENEEDDFENMEIASAFGIMSIYCNSELHSWGSFEGEDGNEYVRR